MTSDVHHPDRRRKPSWMASDHIITREGHVLRRSGKAGAHATQWRPVEAEWRTRVIAGLTSGVLR